MLARDFGPQFDTEMTKLCNKIRVLYIEVMQLFSTYHRPSHLLLHRQQLLALCHVLLRSFRAYASVSEAGPGGLAIAGAFEPASGYISMYNQISRTRTCHCFELCLATKSAHHGDLETPSTPMIVVDILEDLVETLRHERPEIVYWPVIAYLVRSMH